MSLYGWMLAALMTAGCADQQARNAAANGPAIFPDQAKSTMPEGDFVNLDDLGKVKTGMTKAQLHRLLGTPHFNEGVFGVRTWNYLFDFRNAGSNGDTLRCQYQVAFDKHGLSTGMYWMPASCSRVLLPAPQAEVVPTTAPMPSEPVRLSSDMLFDFDKSELTSSGKQKLSQVLAQVRNASDIQDVVVVGYTDRLGSARYNLELSRRRASSVRDYLVAGGVPENVITAHGRGAENPIVHCANSDKATLIICLAPNRRVELSGTAKP
ncbi:OmpA family protein [Rhodanobacter sp. L36]|uniref:OmpA family protein n=1 Tax=Rhodanobacter sp. L36 TaxID=1747221 RepID=UPI0020B1446C|nr:OmpA family protein [Rhodanobacter sp. L36]